MATEFAAGQHKEEFDGVIASLEKLLDRLKIRTENTIEWKKCTHD